MRLAFRLPGNPGKTPFLLCIMLASALSAARAQSQSPAVYSIVAARSTIELAVFRGGLLKGIAHDHTIAAKIFSGEVRYSPANMENSSIGLSIESGSLIVLDDPGVPEKDRKEIQATMLGERVLDAKKFSKILFRSAGVSSTKSGEEVKITGRLNLHGLEREITFSVHIQPERTLLRATGMVAIAQTDFGIKPVKAALGTIRVKDRIEVRFNIVAERINP